MTNLKLFCIPLLIDFAREDQQEGHDIVEAVRVAGAVRLRPILLTTVTLLFGVAPMVPEPVMGGLTIALIFGSLTPAMLVVFVVPVFYRVSALAASVQASQKKITNRSYGDSWQSFAAN